MTNWQVFDFLRIRQVSGFRFTDLWPWPPPSASCLLNSSYIFNKIRIFCKVNLYHVFIAGIQNPPSKESCNQRGKREEKHDQSKSGSGSGFSVVIAFMLFLAYN